MAELPPLEQNPFDGIARIVVSDYNVNLHRDINLLLAINNLLHQLSRDKPGTF